MWSIYCFIKYFLMLITVRVMLEKMGKTLFFRSGGNPLILSEEQRETRKCGRLLVTGLTWLTLKIMQTN